MDANDKIWKIAIVGPESTGKSTLAEQLADYYNTVWVSEYAREYCSQLTRDCTWEDEINIFKGQLKLEQDLLLKANKILICDTTFMTVKIWCDHIFGKAPQEVLNELPRHPYDYYLLMDIDLPWQDDPLRDFPTMREYFMKIWQQELKALNARYSTISGSNTQRFDNAVNTIDAFVSPSVEN